MSASILVIDDSNMIRMQVRRALVGAGFSVIEASDGVDGLQKLADTSEVRLVFCDVNMPRMSGIEFLQEVGKSGSTVPVVMLTTEAQPSLIEQATALGAKGWIVKPFKPDALIAVAKKVVA